MHLARVASAGWFVIATLGCQRDIPVIQVAPGIEPFADLGGIVLGMRAKELLALRPRVSVASYYGYHEILGSRDITYEVSGSMEDGQAPPMSSDLKSVGVTERLADNVEPFKRWQAEVNRINSLIGAEPTCFSIDWSVQTTVHVWLAVWKRDGAELFILGHPSVDVTPATLRSGVTRPGTSLRHAGGSATQVACSTLARDAA